MVGCLVFTRQTQKFLPHPPSLLLSIASHVYFPPPPPRPRFDPVARAAAASLQVWRLAPPLVGRLADLGFSPGLGGVFILLFFYFCNTTDPSLATVRASLLVALLVVRVPPWPAETASPLTRSSVSRPPGLYARRAATLDLATEANTD